METIFITGGIKIAFYTYYDVVMLQFRTAAQGKKKLQPLAKPSWTDHGQWAVTDTSVFYAL